MAPNMENGTWAKAIGMGILGQPNVFPAELTVKFSNGSALTLSGPSLSDFWGEMITALVVYERTKEMIQAQQTEAQATTVPMSEELRKALQLVKTKYKEDDKASEE